MFYFLSLIFIAHYLLLDEFSHYFVKNLRVLDILLSCNKQGVENVCGTLIYITY